MKFIIQTGTEKKLNAENTQLRGRPTYDTVPVQHTIDVPEKDAYGAPYSEAHMFRAAQKHAQGATCFPAVS